MKQTQIEIMISALFLIMSSMSVVAQSYTISGTVMEGRSAKAMPGALATATMEGQMPKGETTDENGKFSFKVKEGKYIIKVSFLGYKSFERVMEVKQDVDLGTIRLRIEDKELDEVKAVGVLQRQEQRGDTTIFNAEAFKVNPDATTEDLIKKMPGMQVQNGTVKAGGESVKRVLVDGKEYFGDDPMAALKNIQADMVSKIEVYDRQSDQSQFTGFSDGNEEKTINILTKMGILSGYFGRVYVGYGTDDRYEGGGNINYFNGNHRLSLLAMSNNINEQNFSFEDMSSAMSNGGGGAGMFDMGSGGKNKTSSVGLNYTYDKEKKLKVELSYSYRYNKNMSAVERVQEYFSNNVGNVPDSLRIYSSESDSDIKNHNNRITLRLTWTINEKNSIIFAPRINWQSREQENGSLGEDTYDGRSYSTTMQGGYSESSGLSLNGNMIWRHKFDVDHRTFSLNVSSSMSDSESEKSSFNMQDYRYDQSRTYQTIQQMTNDNNRWKVSMSAMFTEPVGEKMALQINYSPSYTYSDGDKRVEADTLFVFDDVSLKDIMSNTGSYNYRFSKLLSNTKSSEYWQHRGGVGLNVFEGNKLNATIGLDLQHSDLSGEQVYPYEYDTKKSFTSVMPSATLRIRDGRKFNMRVNYNKSTSAPSISQMQKVVDVSNIRHYTTGNENLSQSYSHSVRLFVMKNNPETSKMVHMMLDYTATRNYIGTSSLIAVKDTMIEDGIILPKGTEFTKPVNMNGSWSGRMHAMYSTPVMWLGSNVNFSLGANMSSNPLIYNGRKGKSEQYGLNGGMVIGSSFSENVDFTVSYNGNYNIIRSTSATSSNNNTYSHGISFDLKCLFFERMTLANNMSHQLTKGMGKQFDKSYIKWNASVGCKVLKDKSGEVKLRVNDILDNSQSVSRSIGSAYVETSRTDVLRRFVMLSFVYKIKPISQQQQMEKAFNGWGGERPPMGPPPGGRGSRSQR